MALDTYSAILGWLNQGTGNNNNSWGDNCDNAIFPIFERAIAGRATHAVTGGTLDLSDDPPPAGPTAALDMVHAFTGTLASNQVVEVPNLSKLWLVHNATTGAYTLTFKTPSGAASAAIPQGGWALVFCDGADGIAVGLSTALRDVQFLGPDGTLAAPGLSFAAEATMGLRRVSAGVLALTIDGVDVATFSSSTIAIDSSVSTNIVPPGTEANYAGITEPDGWYFEYGQQKSRATDAALMNAITMTFTADTNATTTLSNLNKDLRNLGLEGSVLEGTGIPTGATIVSVDSATQITISAAATNTATAGAMRAFPYGAGDGSTTFTLPDARGTVAAGRDNMGGTAAGRVTSAGSGVNGLSLKTLAGSQSVTIATTNLPPYTPSGTITNGAISLSSVGGGSSTQFYARYTTTGLIGIQGGPYFHGLANDLITPQFSQAASTFTGTAQGGASTPLSNMSPTRIRNVIIKR